MKFIGKGRDDRKEDEDLSKTAFQAPCAHCTNPVDVSQFTADIQALANRICETKRWQPIGRDELVLCAGCYRNHRRELARQIQAENDRAEAYWEGFKQEWPGKSKAGRLDLEATFKREFPWLGARAADWVAKFHANNGQGKTSSKDSATGFGR